MMGRRILISLLIVFLCMLVYGQTLTHTFVNYDDPLYVTDNQQVLAGLSWRGVTWSFVTERAMYFHPLTWLSHMADVEVYGLRPWGHHLTNLLFHAANSVLLFVVALRLTGRLWTAGMAGILFAIHPLHVESVAWISERKDVLSTLFWLGAMYCQTRRRQDGGRGWTWATAGMFVLGFMSKPMVVTLPFALLLLDFWPLKQVEFAAPLRDTLRRISVLLLEKWPLLLMTVAMCAVTVVMQMRGNNLAFGEKVPLLERCGNAAVVYVIYLAKTLWPTGLAPYYPHPLSRPLWEIGGALLILAAISGTALWQVRQRPYLLMGWCWFLGTLLPVIELVQAGSFSHADRYVYIPHIGLIIAIAYGAEDLFGARKRLRTVLASVAVLLLTWTALAQAHYWADSETLFKRALEVTGENPVALNNHGAGLSEHGKHEEAIAEYQRALVLLPTFTRAMDNIGVARYAQSRYTEAEESARAALAMDPKYANAMVNLGRALLKLGNPDAALKQFNDAIAESPSMLGAYCNLGEFWIARNDYAQAEAAYAKALEINPRSRPANLGLVEIAAHKGDFAAAAGHCEIALHIWPYDAQTLYNLGTALERLGKPADAAQRYTEALGYDPKLAQAHNNLAGIFLNSGQFADAQREAAAAIALDNGYLQARNTLANALASMGSVDDAREAYLQALQLDPNYTTARLNLAQLLIGAGKLDEALLQVSRILESDPANQNALMLKAEIEKQK